MASQDSREISDGENGDNFERDYSIVSGKAARHRQGVNRGYRSFGMIG